MENQPRQPARPGYLAPPA